MGEGQDRKDYCEVLGEVKRIFGEFYYHSFITVGITETGHEGGLGFKTR